LFQDKNKELLELLDEDSFKHFAKPGRHLIARIGNSNDQKKDGNSWYAEAYFLVEGEIAKGKKWKQ
jgi:hypothetical protein